MHRSVRLSVSLAVAGIALVAAYLPAPAQAPKRGGVLKVAEQSDPVGFDTLGKKKAPVYTQLALAYTHNRLLKYDVTGEIVNDLAEKWTQTSPTTYVVTLRKGVRFHNKPPVNGRELTSEDVKFTFDRLAKSPEARLFPTLKAVTTPDKHTVRFELSAPFSSFVANLAATTVYIYAKEAGKPTADGAGDYTAVDTVVGTGPFTLEEYREKQRLVFKRNPDYFESGKPYLDGVELYTIADAAGSIAAMRTGKIDLIPAGRGEGLPHFLVPEARAIAGAKVIPHALFQTSENLIGRLDQKPWSDVRVRRAVSMALDRAGLAKAIFTEGAELFSGPIPLTSKYFVGLDRMGESAAWYRHDLTAAKKLLADAGFPNGLPPTKLTTTVGYGPNYASRTELLKSMLARLGVEASIVTQEYPVWISTTYKGSFEGLVHIPAWTLGDEDEWLGSYTPGDTRNHIHLADAKITELVQQARSAPNEATRARMIGQFVTTFHDQLYRVYLPAPKLITVTSRRVHGYVPPVRGYGYAVALTNTWLE
jgi:peptide/nickel transport system substrate-binding protein